MSAEATPSDTLLTPPAVTPPRPSPLVARSAARRDLFGGAGEVKVWSLLRPDALDPFRAALWCELEPKGSVGAHVQEQYPELVICLAGEGVVSAGGQAYTFIPGACVPLAQGEILRIENRLDAPLSYLIIKAE